jgi:Cut12 conserved domain
LSIGHGDATFVDIPETPAPVFAARAFKHAIFGTPETPAEHTFVSGNEDRASASATGGLPGHTTQRRLFQPSERQVQREKELLLGNQQTSRPVSPVKAPPGILLTPGTANGRRKQVKFGQLVVDNEGKRSKYSRSGLPDNYPGKFPSPWTPKIATPAEPKLQESTASRNAPKTVDKKVESKFTEILESTKQSRKALVAGKNPAQRPDEDPDLTMDFNLPQSASGHYWKEQYQSYSAQSEAETKRLIAKHKLAKEYARRKDDEAVGLRTQLESERKKRQQREKDLERQVKDMRERLRCALAENSKVCTEMLALRLKEEAIDLVEAVKDEDQRQSETSKSGHRASRLEATVHEPELKDIWLDEKVQTGSRRKSTHLSNATGQEVDKATLPSKRHSHRLRISRAEQATILPSTNNLNSEHTDTIRDQLATSDVPLTNDPNDPGSAAAIKAKAVNDRKLRRQAALLSSLDGITTPAATPRRPRPKALPVSASKPLGDRSPNIVLRSPNPLVPGANEERVTITTADFGKESSSRRKIVSEPSPVASTTSKTYLQPWDATAPLEALDMQAAQPITPVSSHKKQTPKRTPRSAATSKELAPERVDAAKERLAARRERRKRTVIK